MYTPFYVNEHLQTFSTFYNFRDSIYTKGNSKSIHNFYDKVDMKLLQSETGPSTKIRRETFFLKCTIHLERKGGTIEFKNLFSLVTKEKS